LFALGNPLIKCSKVISYPPPPPLAPSFSYTIIPSVSSRSSSNGVGIVCDPIPFVVVVVLPLLLVVGLNDRERLGNTPGAEEEEEEDDDVV